MQKIYLYPRVQINSKGMVSKCKTTIKTAQNTILRTTKTTIKAKTTCKTAKAAEIPTASRIKRHRTKKNSKER